MMEKEKVLVFDSKGAFLKMFKRRFKEQFDFIEDSFYNKSVKDFDRVVYVIHNHNEMLNFLSHGKRGSNMLVCLFNDKFYRGLEFLEVTNNLILFDESKTRTEILNELKKFFDNKLDHIREEKSFQSSKVFSQKNQEYYKAMYFLM